MRKHTATDVSALSPTRLHASSRLGIRVVYYGDHLDRMPLGG
jgi:hypothetical protein